MILRIWYDRKIFFMVCSRNFDESIFLSLIDMIKLIFSIFYWSFGVIVRHKWWWIFFLLKNQKLLPCICTKSIPSPTTKWLMPFLLYKFKKILIHPHNSMLCFWIIYCHTIRTYLHHIVDSHSSERRMNENE